MEVDGKETCDQIDLLHPELLSKEGLVEILKQKQIKVDGTHGLEKDALLDFYYKNVIPIPQRKYRQNRRGRKMTQNQILREKRKRTYSEMKGDKTYSIKEKSESGLLGGSRLMSSCNVQPSGDRLKPPPSTINFDRKVIKLNKTSNTVQKSSLPLQEKDTKCDSAAGVIKLNPGYRNAGSNGIAIRTECKTKTTPNTDVIMTSPKAASANSSQSTVTSCSKQVSSLKTTSSTTKIRLKRQGGCDVSVENSSSSASQPNSSLKQSHAHKGTDEKSPRQIDLTKEEKSNSETSDDTEEAVVTKKFKRIAVTWP